MNSDELILEIRKTEYKEMHRENLRIHSVQKLTLHITKHHYVNFKESNSAGGRGVSPNFFNRNLNICNSTITPSGRKVTQGEEEEKHR